MANDTPLITAPRLPDQPLSSETVYACDEYSWLGGGYRQVHVTARHPATEEVVGEASEVRHADNPFPILVKCRIPPDDPLEHVMCEITYGTIDQAADTNG